MHVFDSDYRLDPEDPPLWSWLAMALVPRDAIRVASEPIDPAVTVKFIDRTLWLNSGASAFAALERARAAMALLAPALVILCAWCAWKIAGPTAGIATGGARGAGSARTRTRAPGEERCRDHTGDGRAGRIPGVFDAGA
jgi:hypothetical protein